MALPQPATRNPPEPALHPCGVARGAGSHSALTRGSGWELEASGVLDRGEWRESIWVRVWSVDPAKLQRSGAKRREGQDPQEKPPCRAASSSAAAATAIRRGGADRDRAL